VTRVLVFAISSVVRAGLETLISSHTSLTLAGSSSNLTRSTVVSLIDELQPDVTLIDVGRQDEDLVSELLTLIVKSPTPSLILLMNDPHDSRALAALRNGARAVLMREATAEEIIATIEAVATGLVVLHSTTAESLLAGALVSSPAPDAGSQYEALTPREIEVLGMLAEGLGNRAIAGRLMISEHTVKFHVASILSKLNASSRTEAVILGIRQGLLLI